MGQAKVREETAEQAEARVARVFASTVGREVEGCLDPRDMRGPEWVMTRAERRNAAQVAAEWTAQLRVQFPGKWVGDTEDAEQRQMEADDAVRRSRGMATS